MIRKLLTRLTSFGREQADNRYALIDGDWYLGRYADVAAAKVDPVEHYLNHGASEGRDPHPLFNTEWYLSQFASPSEVGANPVEYFLTQGAAQGKSPHPLFDSKWYVAENPDVGANGENPLLHYLSKGANEGKDPNPHFDSDWYTSRYKIPSGVNPLVHFVVTGAAAGYDPGPSFSASQHLTSSLHKTPDRFDYHHPLVDGDWYLGRYADVAAAKVDPLQHYLNHGASEGRDPHPLFNTEWYLSQFASPSEVGANPVEHFLTQGAAQGKSPHPLFDIAWYVAQNPDVGASDQNPLLHYLSEGAFHGKDPNPYFDSDWYITRYLGSLPGINPLVHFVVTGAAAGYDPGPDFSAGDEPTSSSDDGQNLFDYCRPLIDGEWYLERYADVAAAKMDPVEHYVNYGVSEGREPHPLFNTEWYLSQFAVPSEVGSNPVEHFLRHGAAQGKSPHPLFDVAWYVTANPGAGANGQNPLVHYLSEGAYSARDPNPYFDSDWYITRYLGKRPAKTNPLVHFVTTGAVAEFDPGPNFSTKWYLTTNPEVRRKGENALSHFIASGRAEGRRPTGPKARNNTAVVFLARSADGSTAGLELFTQSYRRFPAGIKHDLIVLRKGGMRKRGAKLALDLMLEGSGVQYIDIDDTAYDIQAYLTAASLLRHEFVCFLNTHSEIMADDWLKKLLAPFESPDVGVTGATASYESLSDSIEISSKAIWLTSTNTIPYNDDLAAILRPTLETHAPQWMAQRDKIAEPDSGSVAVPHHTRDYDIAIRYTKHWSVVSGVGGPLSGLGDFKRFPNPHMRTNAFVMRRQLLVDLDFELGDTKLGCLQFESGPEGLYARLEQKGLKSILVGADGKTFDVERWIDSNTFRLGDQSNIMVKDNRVRDFDNAPANEREWLKVLTWGRYIGNVPKAIEDLGFGFQKASLRVSEPAYQTVSKLQKQIWVSIVIPTHNRLSLVKEALVTVLGQAYPYWECVVFDNASKEPLLEHVQSLNDARVKYARSDEFLPVTASWNKAIDLAQGDYVLLIGDDDGLVPGALDRLVALVKKYDTPELIYSSLYQFFHPGVAPWEPSGTVVDLRMGYFFTEKEDDFRLSHRAAKLAVQGSLELRRCFAFNMQAQFYERGFLQRLRREGKVFHSPFPDYYIANVAMVEARSIVAVPRALTVAGVSRKSFGFTLFNKMPERGASLLNTTLANDAFYEKAKSYILPGSDYNTNYIITMEHVLKALNGRVDTSLRIDRYRQLQIFFALGEEKGILSGITDSVEFDSNVWPLLNDTEKAWAKKLLSLSARAKDGDREAIADIKDISKGVDMAAPSTDALWARSLWTGEFATLPELFDALATARPM